MAQECWEFYFAQLGGRSASIFFDDCLSARLEGIDLPNALRLRVTMKQPGEDGLSSSHEFDALNQLENTIVERLARLGTVHLGRVTTGGQRYINFLTSMTDGEAAPILALIQAETGYEIRARVEPDPQRTAYWDELYPSDDDRSLLNDLKCFENLAGAGDQDTIGRQIDHLVCFKSSASRLQFQEIIERAGFKTDRLYEDIVHNPDVFCMAFSRVDKPRMGDFTKMNIALRRKVSELDGKHEGWTCSAVTD